MQMEQTQIKAERNHQRTETRERHLGHNLKQTDGGEMNERERHGRRRRRYQMHPGHCVTRRSGSALERLP
ncbi:unnamed protein product [Pleuronectes platessa]|uniref:Uncharacterized protein n=1 Tax=Pleuronectes platessa TaxID=8262 RepID=A0A9N7VDQ6_PLEPL|nr:unnamed protein product [Pleuronectes platessa]